MRNPIFADSSIFLDHVSDSDVRYVSSDKTVTLSDGSKIMRLETRQPLVEITTASGFSLTMAPESAFALLKDDDGRLLRYAPVASKTPALVGLIDWLAPLHDVSHRRFALAGMIMGRGMHLFHRFRVSYTIVPTLDLAFEVKAFLEHLGNKYVADGLMHVNSNSVEVRDTDGGYIVRSRILTLLVGPLLAEKTLTPNFYPAMIEHDLFYCFVRGLLSTAGREDADIVVRHRNADTIRTIGEQIYYQFGVPCAISVDPMEPKIQSSLSLPKGHRFRLSSDPQQHAALAGLIEGDGKEVKFWTTDTIETIVPLQKKVNSVIILPGDRARNYPLSVNGFAFRASFEIPVGVAEIASHPALLRDSSDPTNF